MRVITRVLLLWGLLLGFHTPLHADYELPVGWEQFGLPEFVNLSKTAIDNASESDKVLLAKHAWSQFLADPTTIASGDWSSLLSLVDLYSDQQAALDPTKVNAQVASFRAAMAERLESQETSGVAFSELVETDRVLAAAGISRAKLAVKAVEWMEEADWKSLDVSDGIALANMVNDEIVPVEAFSVQWRGMLTPLASGEYVFRQVRHHRIDGTVVLIVNGQTILDSTSADRALHDTDDFASKAIELIVGQPVTIEVRYVYDKSHFPSDSSDPWLLYPMLLFKWDGPGFEDQVVPTDVFQLPADYEGSVESGLVCNYYADTGFSQLLATRVVESPQLIASQHDVLSTKADYQQRIVSYCCESLVAGGELSNSSSVDEFVRQDLSDLLRYCSYEQRVQIVNAMTTEKVMSQLSPDAVRAFVPHAQMISSQQLEDAYILWFNTVEPAPARVSWYPSWQGWAFAGQTYDQYGWAGSFLRYDKWLIAESLIKNGLENEDGSCNLLAVYTLTYPALMESKLDLLKEQIEARVDNEELSGDCRATWHIARAFVREYSGGGIPRPALGLADLEEASLLAESSDLQFRIAQERIARMGTLGMMEPLKELAEQSIKRFPAHAVEVNESVSLAEHYVAHRKSLVVEESPAEKRAKLLRKEIQLIEAGQPSRQLSRLKEELAALEQKISAEE